MVPAGVNWMKNKVSDKSWVDDNDKSGTVVSTESTGIGTWLDSLNNEAVDGIVVEMLWATKLDLSKRHEGWSSEGLEICSELVGKYWSLKSSI